eukprot:NODE_111_length_19413_cov_0.323703.p5 type:complete len:324 gc:universal NODE_111_length_19413_cov_0.323703:3141-2170(-)
MSKFFSSFQSPPENNKCHLVVSKQAVNLDNKVETVLYKYSAIINKSEGSDFVFVTSQVFSAEFYSIYYHCDFIYIGLFGKVLILETRNLKVAYELQLMHDDKYDIPLVNSLLFIGNTLCVGCSDATIQFFDLDVKGYNFISNLVLPSSLLANSFRYSENYLYFATISGYFGKVLLKGFKCEYFNTNVNISSIAVSDDLIYITSDSSSIITYKKQQFYEISEQVHTYLKNESIINLFISYPFIYFLTDKGICYRCDPSEASEGPFLVTKMDKEYSIDVIPMALQRQNDERFCVECCGSIQIDNCFACVAVNEYGDVQSIVAPLV